MTARKMAFVVEVNAFHCFTVSRPQWALAKTLFGGHKCVHKQTQILAVSINNDNNFQPFTLLLSFLFKKKDDYNNLCQPVHVNNKYDLSVSWHEIWFQLIKWSRILNSCRKRANLISLLRSLPPSAAHPPPHSYLRLSFIVIAFHHSQQTIKRIISTLASGQSVWKAIRGLITILLQEKYQSDIRKTTLRGALVINIRLMEWLILWRKAFVSFSVFFFILFELSIFFHPSAMYIHIGCENMDIFCWEYGITVTRERKMNVQR